MRSALPLLLFWATIAVGAETQTYKCRDAGGNLTYSNQTCEKQGLKDAGPVRERLMTVPSPKAAKRKPVARQAEKKEPEKER